MRKKWVLLLILILCFGSIPSMAKNLENIGYLGHPYYVFTVEYEPGLEKYGREYLIDVPAEWIFYSNMAYTKGECSDEGFYFPSIGDWQYSLEIERLDKLSEFGDAKTNLTPFAAELKGMSSFCDIWNPIETNINGKHALSYKWIKYFPSADAGEEGMSCLFNWNQTLHYRLIFATLNDFRLNKSEEALARKIFQSFREPEGASDIRPTPTLMPPATPPVIGCDGTACAIIKAVGGCDALDKLRYPAIYEACCKITKEYLLELLNSALADDGEITLDEKKQLLSALDAYLEMRP